MNDLTPEERVLILCQRIREIGREEDGVEFAAAIVSILVAGFTCSKEQFINDISKAWDFYQAAKGEQK